MCVYTPYRRHTHTFTHDAGLKNTCTVFFVLFRVLFIYFYYYYYYVFFSRWLAEKKGKNDEHDCQLYSPRTYEKKNKNVTRVNKTGKCAQQQVTREYTHA